MALPPMTLAISSSLKPASMRASVTWTSPVASNGVWTAPSKSEPSATWSMPATFVACLIDRAIAAASSPPQAVGQNPIPIRPPVAGDGPQVIVGQVAGVVGDALDAGVRRDDRPRRDGQHVVDRGDDAWATSTIIRRASIRRIIS